MSAISKLGHYRTLKPAIDGGDVIVCDLDESVELPE